MTVDPRARLVHVVQLRLTEAQWSLLQEVAHQVGRPVSGVMRDVVTVWAMQQLDEREPWEALDSASQKQRNAWVRAMVDELRTIGDDDAS
jgi:hypothetical protein